MVQWIHVLQNNSFINTARLFLLHRNSRTIALVQPGLTAGWLADKIWVYFKFLKYVIDQIF